MRKGTIPTVFVSLIVATVFMTISVRVVKIINEYKYAHYAQEMLNSASQYIENGEYNLQGLKIICGYIDGNFLNRDTSQYFCLEVARNYFEIQKDYVLAKTYFRRLDESVYPEKQYYLRLCEMMSGFEKCENAEVVLDEFSEFNRTLPKGERRDNNERLVDFLYEDLTEGRKERTYGKK